MENAKPNPRSNNYPYGFKIGIIILNWNNWQETKLCLEQLHSYLERFLEIWVIDNGSQDESVTNLSEITDIHFIQLTTNLGFAEGNNIGIQKALDQNCDYILLLNNDIEITNDFLRPLLEPFRIDPQAGISCPKILFKEPQNTLWYAGGKFHKPRILGELIGLGEPDLRQYDQMVETDFAVGTCMLVKQEVLSEIGKMDNRFFFYHEDVDFCYRAKRAGFHIWYQPGSTIVHKVSESTKHYPGERIFLYERARVIFLFKYIRGWNIPVVIIMETLRLFRRVINDIIHHQLNLTKSYFEGLLSGLQDARRYHRKVKDNHEHPD